MASRPGPSSGPSSSSQRGRPPSPSRLGLAAESSDMLSKPKKKKHRAGRKHQKKKQQQQQRQQQQEDQDGERSRPGITGANSSFFRSYRSDRNLSSTSLESDALLDHRGHNVMRPRRNSRTAQALLQTSMNSSSFYRRRQSRSHHGDGLDENGRDDPRAPLLAYTHQSPNNQRTPQGYGAARSSASSITSRHSHGQGQDYDVNNPPSMPGSPALGAIDPGFGDVLEGDLGGRRPASPDDFVVNIDDDISERSESPRTARGEKRHTFNNTQATDDVCFPQADMSEWNSETHDDDYMHRQTNFEEERVRGRRRRRRWPNFEVLEEWAQEERAHRKNEQLQAKKVREPQYIDGRLRPKLQQLLREPDDEVNRFTYFNEQFEATIHASSISELVQEGQTFRDFFAPEPPVLSDSSDDEDDGDETPVVERKPSQILSDTRSETSPSGPSHSATRQSSLIDSRLNPASSVKDPAENSGGLTPINEGSAQGQSKSKKYGNPPAFWLDIMCPTDAEMKLLTHVFNLHPLTTEDILMRESREKVELFRHYYFVHYRAFDQDPNSVEYMEPVNFYIIVFKEGIITFHFAPTPHPAHVRRRIRTLNDYVPIDSDWLCYALIDSITDAYQPVVEGIENKVDEIDDAILEMHEGSDDDSDCDCDTGSINEKKSISSEKARKNGSMLKRVGKIRKRTMNLSRLLSTKADVIKQFAKRCTERYDVAPRSDIGLFLGDIQDHIITMQSSLSHYEMILGRAHSNYLAQISFRMNQRQEEASGSLNKLTVLGTILLPMTMVSSLWGMNVKVPGEGIDDEIWFYAITASLFVFGGLSYFIARMMKII